jgi:virulence factor Mce-like protein
MRSGSVFANPVLVGAVTILVVVVAVFLSYNANNGLPFVPTKQLTVRTPDGANLVPGNEVRSGGYRIGVVTDMIPVRTQGGEVVAELKVKLDKAVGDVAKDSKFRIRSRSALGLKYLDLQKGSSSELFEDGAQVPLEAGSASSELDRVYEIFDRPTRKASQQNLRGFGDAFAGRGPSLNAAIQELPELFGSLEPVMRNLADPDTGLGRFFQELGDTARVIAPVSKQQARLFTTMADTFEAFGRDPAALQALIEKSPSTLDVSTDSLRVQRPFLSNLADFADDFGPATADLRAALPVVNDAIRIGIPVTRRGVQLNNRLASTLTALDQLVSAPTTDRALRGLTGTVTSLNPALRFIGPYVTVCNATNYFFTYLSEHVSEPDNTGTSERALLNSAGNQKNSFGSIGAVEPANGEDVERGNAQFGQYPAGGRAVTDDGKADCENGQRGFLARQARFADKKYKVQYDYRTPGVQGPLFKARPEVPKGQTFTALPESGPDRREFIPNSESGDK